MRVNAFDWNVAFPKVFNTGGFNAVIGNPPYGALISGEEVLYLKQHYKVAEYQINTYPLFIENSLKLSSNQGIFGLIIPSAWVMSRYDEELRKMILNNSNVNKIVITPKKTFEDATVETMILIGNKSKSEGNVLIIDRWDLSTPISYQYKQVQFSNGSNYFFPIYSHPDTYLLLGKIRENHNVVSAFSEAVWGVKIYQKGKGKPPQKGFESEKRIYHSSERIVETHKPILGGSEVNRYHIEWVGGYVNYGEWLAEPRSPKWFSGERILLREVTAKGIIQACYTNSDFVFSNSVDGLRIFDTKVSYKELLGILNSKLLSFYHLNTSANAYKGAFPKILIKDILGFPIANLSEINKKKMENLVENMLFLHKQSISANLPEEKEHLLRQIQFTDRQIDFLVYETYGLTEEEIKIVENA